MSRSPFLPDLPPTLTRSATLLGAMMGMALLVPSCLTPDFEFGQNPDDRDGMGGGAVAEHCTNRLKDADETDVDCGGLDCEPCALGQDCNKDGDCVNGTCTEGKCQDPTCTDGIKNGSETDIDCGGDGCGPCADDKVCGVDDDCRSKVCEGSRCQAPTCTDRVENGNETDVDCGGSDCSTCDSGKGCAVDNDCTPVPEEFDGGSQCIDNVCTVLCTEGLADCNNRVSDGCEEDIQTSMDHCGTCGSACAPDNAANPQCQGGLCLIGPDGCDNNYADCDNDNSNGCEVDVRSDSDHCGACNDACGSTNGTGVCSGSKCTMNCDSGYDSCDDENTLRNGCEVRSSSDIGNCGDCAPPEGSGAICTSVDETPYCANGSCGSTDCPDGFGDCDGNDSCTDDLTTVSNCGGCGIICTFANATPSCSSGTCDGSCNTNYGNCDGNPANGCESDHRVDLNNCGGCASGSGEDCAAKLLTDRDNIAEAVCTVGDCQVKSCDEGYADCDGVWSNGCEVRIENDEANCGGCVENVTRSTDFGSGVDCNDLWPNATGTCTDGTCTDMTCRSGYDDCDDQAPGCEADLNNDVDTCGSCSVSCSDGNAYTDSTSCDSGTCDPVCESTGSDCDGDPANGCENIDTDADNCGGCNIVCGGSGGTNVDSASCSGGDCSVTCTSNFCTDGSAQGLCTAPLGTTTNCTQCGESCSGDTPYCHADASVGNGCKSYKPIDLVDSDDFTFNLASVNSGSSKSFNLSGAEAGHRMLVVITTGQGNNGQFVPTSITYAEQPLNEIESLTSGGKASAGVYYLDECDLLAAGNGSVSISVSPSSYGGFGAEVLLFENVERGLPVSYTNTTSNTQTISLSDVAVIADSWFVASAANQSKSLTATTPTSPTPDSTTLSIQALAGISTKWGPFSSASTRTFTWSSDWEAKAAAGVVLEPATTAATACP